MLLNLHAYNPLPMQLSLDLKPQLFPYNSKNNFSYFLLWSFRFLCGENMLTSIVEHANIFFKTHNLTRIIGKTDKENQKVFSLNAKNSKIELYLAS